MWQGLAWLQFYTNAAATTEEDDDWMTATTEDAAYQDLSKCFSIMDAWWEGSSQSADYASLFG